MQYCHILHHAPAVFHRCCISDYHTYPISQLNTKYTCEYISVNFSSCFYNVEGDFLLNKINFVGGDKLLPVFKHGFLRSEENVFPVFLYTQNVYGKMLSFTILIFNVWLVVFPYL